MPRSNDGEKSPCSERGSLRRTTIDPLGLRIDLPGMRRPRACCRLTCAAAAALQPLHLPLHRAQVLLECRERFATRCFIRGTQQRRRMHRRDHTRRPGVVGDRLSAMFRYPKVFSENRLRRGRAQRDDHAWLNELHFRFQPRLARFDLPRRRLRVNALLAARLKLEMFDGVGDVRFAAIDADLVEKLVEQFSRRTDEWFASEIFLIPRLLADEHDLRMHRAFPEDGLRRMLVKITSAAALACGPHRRQRKLRGQKQLGGREDAFRHKNGTRKTRFHHLAPNVFCRGQNLHSPAGCYLDGNFSQKARLISKIGDGGRLK